ncbi:DUF3302 domain-containing protein [Klebsiella pneumoniae]|nr:DUF3302 domain-containing protein [Klebsiella pneumoniae]
MFLNYFCVGSADLRLLLVIFAGIIAIHDIPYLIAKKRNQSPHADAIHTAGWVSLFYSACYLAVSVDSWATLYQIGARLGHAASAAVASQEQ